MTPVAALASIPPTLGKVCVPACLADTLPAVPGPGGTGGPVPDPDGALDAGAGLGAGAADAGAGAEPDAAAGAGALDAGAGPGVDAAALFNSGTAAKVEPPFSLASFSGVGATFSAQRLIKELMVSLQTIGEPPLID